MKLTPKYEYKKDGSKRIRSYSISIRKSFAEKLNWNDTTTLEIELEKNYIVIKNIKEV